ncbi:MAG: hypothetical protein O9333_17930 [Beijerinckiaceae bacterium]|nr:hypothetical protein [Beijerinckiaceae bacterium]
MGLNGRIPTFAGIGMLSLCLAACQTTQQANLSAGAQGGATPIIVSTTIANSFYGGTRLGQSSYFYINTGSEGAQAARLGVGLAFGAIGALANAAIVQSNTEKGAAGLQGPFSAPAFAISASRIAATIPNARVDAAATNRPAGVIILFPGIILQEADGALRPAAMLRGIQTDAAGQSRDLLPRSQAIPIPLNRDEVIAGQVPAGFMDDAHAVLANLAKEALAGTPGTSPPASNTGAGGLSSPDGQASNAPPRRGAPGQRVFCNHTRVCVER